MAPKLLRLRPIPRYFWQVKRGLAQGLDFEEYFFQNQDTLTRNMHIARLSGPDKLDIYLRYEDLSNDMAENDLGFIWDTFRDLRAKSGHRPAKGNTPAEMFSKHPRVVHLIADVCREEIERFRYESLA